MQKINENSQVAIADLIDYSVNHSNIVLKIRDFNHLERNYSLCLKKLDKHNKSVCLKSITSCKNLIQNFYNETPCIEHKQALIAIKKIESIADMYIQIHNDGLLTA